MFVDSRGQKIQTRIQKLNVFLSPKKLEIFFYKFTVESFDYFKISFQQIIEEVTEEMEQEEQEERAKQEFDLSSRIQ